MTITGNLFQPARGAAPCRPLPAPAIFQRKARMAARPDSQPILCPPVNQIMPAFCPGTGIVGDFIAMEASLCHSIFCSAVKIRHSVRTDPHRLTCAGAAVKDGAGFDGQLIG